jgi:hypothetical protein
MAKMKVKQAEKQLHPTLCQYLGHFKQARYMREGHNTNAVIAPDGFRADGSRIDTVPGMEWKLAQDQAALEQQRAGGSNPWGGSQGFGQQSRIQPYSPSKDIMNGRFGEGVMTPLGGSPTSSIGSPSPYLGGSGGPTSLISQLGLFRNRRLYV